MRKTRLPEAIHTWLIMLRMQQAITNYLLPPIIQDGLGSSDFRVLDVLLHKGPMSVNAIGPKVDLNPGSVSVAVDRLYKKGLVNRVEDEKDRRIRVVSLTEKGRKVFLPMFRRHMALLERAFEGVPPEERIRLEEAMKKIGRQAEVLAENQDFRI